MLLELRFAGSEAERQELGAAGCVAIHQGAEADLVSDACAGDRFGEDADHDAEHGGTAVEQFNALQLLHVDLLCGAIPIPLLVGGGVGHGFSPGRSGRGCPGR